MANQTLDNLLSTGIYNPDIINSLKSKNFSALKELSSNELSSATYMYPLLWAVKNELGTFAVYSYMSEELQSDPDITAEVIKVQPELFTESPLSKDRRFILAHIQTMPQLSYYMSETLKTDSGFIMELCAASSPEVAKQILSNTGMQTEENEHMASMEVESDIVDGAIVASVIASPESLTIEQKNNHNLLKEAAKQNYEFVKYVAQNADSFGFDGLEGVSEAVRDMAVTDFKEKIIQNRESSPIKNIDDLLDFTQEDIENNPAILQRVAAMAKLGQAIDPKLARMVVDYSKVQMAKAKTPEGAKALADNPDAHMTFLTPEVVEACARVVQEHEPEAIEDSFLAEYSAFHDEEITLPKPPWEEEEAYYDEQMARIEAEAEAAGIPPEEYIKTHPFPEYEEYLQMQQVEQAKQENDDVSIDDVKDAVSEVKSADIDKLTTKVRSDISKGKIPPEQDDIEIV